ncbi:hypothetical protein LTR78_008004 [Recurvomyces mirabilis]|uniref:Thioredoxin domain-containing protein n=1 Tax=Recurvomyces mirabilis TaxID=574656 RepID=A0AAE0TQM9_9PEZI|nr:hypothetical protein LTR78_008004 [Recurvomyces mirabilis]KAK5150732.1 hypothetical protein LTS14_009794 [Recurvomyces mirabilis]
MRPSTLLRYLAASLLPTTLASQQLLPREDGPSGDLTTGHDGSTTTTGGGDNDSTFNDKVVPELTSLTSDTLKPSIESGYWLVEFFSPYCVHCKHFAPTWQTLYEFYYTQDTIASTSAPIGSAEAASSFTKYYDFHFAKVDCASNGDACADNKINSFPTIVMFKDGEVVKQQVGGKDIKFMGKFVEEVLETIHPGSRPKGGPKLPKAGDHEVEKTLMPEQAPGPVNKDGVEMKATGTKSLLTATKVAEPVTPNLDGKSKALTAENFQRLVTTTHDPWFIKFYAPWCHHCQAMAPNWQGMARQMKGQLNIGEVNCETEKRLCKDVKVKGYPTLLFFRGGERVEYDGLRGLGDLLDFANKAIAVAEPVMDVNMAQFEELEQKEEVLFLYFYDDATTAEDFAALDRLVMSLIGHAKLVKTSDPELNTRYKISTWPRLLVSRDGKPTYYTALSPRDMREFRRVLTWMQGNWLPIVPELTASNAKEVMGANKLVVLGILSRERKEEFIIAKREIKNAALEWIDKQTQAFQLERQELRDAKQLRIEEAEDRNDQRALRAAKSIRINMDDIERKDVGFAWVDGVFWERWIRTTFGISVAGDGERVVMYDYSSHRYWDVTMTGFPIVPSRTSILETLPRVVSSPPKIQPKRTMSVLGHAWWVLKAQVWEHPRVGEKGSAMDGLLGGSSSGNGQGKVD